MNSNIKNIFEKNSNCQIITDEELKEIFQFYDSLSKMVSQLGQEFSLMQKEIYLRRETFSKILIDRQLNFN